MEIGMVERIDIDREMQQAYLDYAMSVIVARALPDARDGLKPVHRRILYAMHDMGLRQDSAFKKSARIVGEVLGKYHPHGDMAVYEAMARMAQDFSMRYLLVEGQGNFGSLDGDPPAAMRYTEARLSAAALQMLADIARNTVNFHENFDGTLVEPDVLPSAIPNLLVNGATGIAVGMATSIPPHNLGEVIDALQYLLENWEKIDDIGIEDLLRFIKGPDFPTGGVILQESEGDGLAGTYSTGRGQVIVQASAHLEEMERGRNRIIVTELPYMTNKSSLIERIAELAREEKIDGIVDLRDESDRQGMRIVIDLSKTADPDTVLRDLYRHTPMRSTFSIIMLALVNGEPRHLSLKQALRVFLDHRLEVVRRRSEYDLEKARQREHILVALKQALLHLDEVISIIRKAPDAEVARAKLMKRFKWTEIQAQAILDMPLKRLAALERKKIDDEYKEVADQIKKLEALLRSPKKMREQVSVELQEVRERFADRRRTHIVQLKDGETKTSLLTKSELVEDREIWISVDGEYLVSRSTGEKAPRQSGREAPQWLVKSGTRDTLFLVNEGGEAAAVPVHALPETDETSQGIPLNRLTPFRDETTLAAVFSLPSRASREASEEAFANRYVLSATRQGMLKKSPLADLPGASAGLFVLVKVNEGDRLGWLKITEGDDEILLATATGMAIRFGEEQIRPMGLVAAGVMGIKLQAQDELCGMDLLTKTGEVLFVSAQGRAKRVAISQFPAQGRYGQGVVAWKLPPEDRVIGMAVGKGTSHGTVHITKLAPKAIRFDEAPLQNRSARGGKLLELKPDQRITTLTVPWEPRRPGGQKRGAGPASADEADAEKENGKTVKAGSSQGTRNRSSRSRPVAGAKTVDKARSAAKAKPVDGAKPGESAIAPAKTKTTAKQKATGEAKAATETGNTAKAIPPAGTKRAAPRKSSPASKPAATKRAAASAGSVRGKPATAPKKSPAKANAPAKGRASAKAEAAEEPNTGRQAVRGRSSPAKTATTSQPPEKRPAAKQPAAQPARSRPATGSTGVQKPAAKTRSTKPTAGAKPTTAPKTTSKAGGRAGSKPSASAARPAVKPAPPKPATTKTPKRTNKDEKTPGGKPPAETKKSG